MMKTRQWLTIIGLLLLVALAITGLVTTRGSNATAAPSGASATASATSTDQSTLVDQRPLQTARRLAALASTTEEQRISQDILRVADHEVDLAFSDALRDATQHPPQLSAEARQISTRLSQAESAVKADQDSIAALTKKLAGASEAAQENLQQQIDVVKAQLELDQDEVEDARADLDRAGGNKQGRIQRLMDEHEATHNDQTAKASPSASLFSSDNLAGQVLAWNTLHQKRLQLAQARQDSQDAASQLSEAHNALEAKVQAEAPAKKDQGKQAASNLQSAPQGGSADSKAAAAAAVLTLRQLSSDQKNLSDLDRRVQDHQELADDYASWIGLVAGYQRAGLHTVIESLLWILLIVLLVYLADRLIDHFFLDPSGQHTRFVTLRAVIRFAVQAIGVLFILFVVFGVPNQMPTILGLAGAGLTVAMKDFIVGFFGWFVLMGRNGLRVGDWVEINGVVGEVVEIGLLRTVLLETGNWTDSGHPTGRKVAFVNSFAIEGHFFNFSTSGQWLWDELQLMIPTSDDPYPVIDAIQKLVVKETEADVHTAEEEWKRATTRYHVRSFSAQPAINLRPTTSGVEVHVRYITRAHERYAVRTRLYQEVVELLHSRQVPVVTPATLPATAAAKNA
jgi:small-conductance mechanosensitive channel